MNSRQLKVKFVHLATLLWSFPVALPALANNTRALIQEKDLSIQTPLIARSVLRSGPSKTGAPIAILPFEWISQVETAFSKTPVGNALELENEKSDWRLVSARIVPCSPLGVTPKQNLSDYCWPEIRIVWQPVVRNFQARGRIYKSYADDRAIHVLYDVDAMVALNDQSKADRISILLSKIKNEAVAQASSNNFEPLTVEEFVEFKSLQKQASTALLNATLELRSKNIPHSAFRGIGERPEFESSREESEFINRLNLFLLNYAKPFQAKALTSFSLPEGRDAPLLDEWVFLAFDIQNGLLKQTPIGLVSATNGKEIFNFGTSPRGSMLRDEPELYTFLDSILPEALLAKEINSSVIVSADTVEKALLIKKISDRNQILVPNTSCASCHKMNQERFDFHNLSFLEDREMTVSPRVVTDVLLDLNWIQNYLD